MAEGTAAPRHYHEPIYCVLLHQAAFEYQLFLSKNGVVLMCDNVPARLLKIVDQLLAIGCNVLRSGRGHMLSSTVTDSTWPSDITYNRVKQEKGVGFEPGGEIPSRVRTTAWDYMGQEIPKNYGQLVLGQILMT